ncbi:protein of unknown function [Candidatus Filomicrobium marinum]|uniref:Uncharacterized protein n=1 Tax=Candidatus Filomicrobium marinum TaxID=1608628 RepID=A0A0D6JH58_9HYPH|nr:protein of unknown function [Candidatus Filomicrobium marinum]CPR20627.1 protein of unknown function [Candidatus Filomicrobium marinum]
MRWANGSISFRKCGRKEVFEPIAHALRDALVLVSQGIYELRGTYGTPMEIFALATGHFGGDRLSAGDRRPFACPSLS